MTFKDKEREIEEFIDEYDSNGKLIDLCFIEFYEMIGIDYIICSISGREMAFSLEDDHIRFKVIRSEFTYNKYEIKFIYDFIEFLESLGFKEELWIYMREWKK